ncbi:MAG: tRNA (guanine-N7-)-methyltransferase, partial [Pirellulaceae bacterium]
MGRRALPRVKAPPDIEQHFRRLGEVEPPIDVKTLFARPDAPLEVEMGSGKGMFMSTASGDHAEHNFLGIEVANKYAESAAQRLAGEERDNAVMFQGDGLQLFREFLVDESVHAVHVYFPDPWWKRKHRKRRVVNESFLKDVVRVLVPSGQLHFWTDVEEYFKVSLKLIASMPELDGPL